MGGLGKTLRTHTGSINGHHLAWLDLANERCTDDIQRASLGCDYPATGQAPQAQRAHTVWVTRGVQRLAIGESKTESTLQTRQQCHRGRFYIGAAAVIFGVVNLAGFVGKQSGHDCGVTGQLALFTQ